MMYFHLMDAHRETLKKQPPMPAASSQQKTTPAPTQSTPIHPKPKQSLPKPPTVLPFKLFKLNNENAAKRAVLLLQKNLSRTFKALHVFATSLLDECSTTESIEVLKELVASLLTIDIPQYQQYKKYVNPFQLDDVNEDLRALIIKARNVKKLADRAASEEDNLHIMSMEAIIRDCCSRAVDPSLAERSAKYRRK